MLRLNRKFATSAAVFITAVSIASTSAHASSFGRLLHLHPRSAQTAAQAQDARIDVRIYNKGQLFQDVKVDGHTYTVFAHQSITVKAPAGTPIYAASTGMGHKDGALLFNLAPEMNRTTVSFN